jgi:hypothetical protein
LLGGSVVAVAVADPHVVADAQRSRNALPAPTTARGDRRYRSRLDHPAHRAPRRAPSEPLVDRLGSTPQRTMTTEPSRFEIAARACWTRLRRPAGKRRNLDP